MSLSADFWAQAQNLAQQAENATGSDSKTLYRTAISRTYYAAFHHARTIIQNDQRFGPQHNSKSHADVIDVLTTQYNARLGDELRRFKGLRNAADYDEHIGDPKQMWPTAKQFAERCLQYLQAKPK